MSWSSSKMVSVSLFGSTVVVVMMLMMMLTLMLTLVLFDDEMRIDNKHGMYFHDVTHSRT